MGCCRKLPRMLFGALVFVGVTWLLLVGILTNHANEETSFVMKMIVEHSHGAHNDLDFNYVSKRRVPNGPDPIHNRKAVNSRWPPGRD